MNKSDSLFDGFKSCSVAIITGGTAGHVIPACDLAFFLNDATVYVSSYGSKYCTAKNKVVFCLEAKSLFSMTLQVIYFLFELRSYDIIIGFGSFLSIPALIAAKILGKQIYTHEQNGIEGEANIFLKTYFGVKILQTFNISDDDITGLPITYTKNNTQLISNDGPILVLAGSGGSVFFDEKLFPIINKWAEENKQMVYFQTINKSTKFVQCCEFFDNYMELIEKAKFIVSRAGSSSISKFLLLKKNAILIPNAKSVKNHQYYNAKLSGYEFIEEHEIDKIVPLLNNLLENYSISHNKNSSMNLFLIPE